MNIDLSFSEGVTGNGFKTFNVHAGRPQDFTIRIFLQLKSFPGFEVFFQVRRIANQCGWIRVSFCSIICVQITW